MRWPFVSITGPPESPPITLFHVVINSSSTYWTVLTWRMSGSIDHPIADHPRRLVRVTRRSPSLTMESAARPRF